jgi:hypothetical protein
MRGRRGSKGGRRWSWLGLAAYVLAPAAALGGAWTMPQGEGQVIASLLGWAGDDAPYGFRQITPPSESRLEAQTYIQYGLTNDVTIFGEASLEHYELSAPIADVYNGFDYSDAGLRAKLWSSGPLIVSAEATAFLPGAREPTRPAQAGDTGGAGEGRLLGGYNFTLWSTPGFLDAEVGYRLRAAGPPDEWHGDATLGIRPWPRLTAMAQLFNTISSPSTNPLFPAWRSHVAEVSLVYALDDRWSLQIGTFASFATVNTNSERGAVVAVWRTF